MELSSGEFLSHSALNHGEEEIYQSIMDMIGFSPFISKYAPPNGNGALKWLAVAPYNSGKEIKIAREYGVSRKIALRNLGAALRAGHEGPQFDPSKPFVKALIEAIGNGASNPVRAAMEDTVGVDAEPSPQPSIPKIPDSPTTRHAQPSKTLEEIRAMQVNGGLVEGVKASRGKPRWSLLQWAACEQVVKLSEFGASKYAPHNWRKLPTSELEEALLRHTAAHARGETIDPETGMSHMTAIAWNALCILELTGEGE